MRDRLGVFLSFHIRCEMIMQSWPSARNPDNLLRPTHTPAWAFSYPGLPFSRSTLPEINEWSKFSRLRDHKDRVGHM